MNKLLILCFLLVPFSRASFAQITGPTVVCPSTSYTYTGGDGIRSSWSFTGSPTVVSRNGGVWTTTSMVLKFTANCVITINEYEQDQNGNWFLSQTSTLNVNVVTTGTITGSSTVCPSTSFTLSAPGTSGNSFNWQSSPSGQNTWTTFASNQSAYATPSTTITASTDFRLVSNDCSTIISATKTITVYTGVSSAGSISGAQTICYGATPTTLQEVSTPTASPSYTYQWQSRVNSGAWSNITGATSNTYSPGPLYQTTDYQRLAVWSCSSSQNMASNIVTVTVNATSVGGTVSSTNGTSFCGTSSVNLKLTGYTGSIVAWYYQYNDGSGWSSWTSFGGAGSSTNQLSLANNGSVNRSYQFYATVQDGVCSPAGSPTYGTITDVPTTTGSIAPALVEAYTSTTANYTLGGYPSSATLLWQQSPDGFTWTCATGSNTVATYTGNTGGITILSTTKYRVQVTNGTCVNYSPVLPVIISQVPVISSSLNYLAMGNSVTLTTNLNNGASYNSYQWYRSGTLITGAISSNYSASEPASYTVVVTSSTTSPAATSAAFNVYGVGLQPDNTVNSVVTTTIRQAGVSTSTDIYTLPSTGYAQSIQYLDMLSRPVQTVGIGQSPLMHDVIQPYGYDSLQPPSYLPYVDSIMTGTRRTTAIFNGTYQNSKQYKFYQKTGTKIATSTAPLSRTVYESSPIGRVLESGAPDTDWQTGTGGTLGAHTLRPFFYCYNSGFPVRMWTTSGPSGYYATGSLAVSKVTDENGHPVMTYADKLGRTVLKRVKTSGMPDTTTWLETYYVYDGRGNLAMQIPPKVSSMLNAGSSWSTGLANAWCFVYTYDVRNRLVQSQAPGTAAAYYVYDPLGRVVLTQDARLRTNNQWAFLKYDVRGRTMMTGIYTNNIQTSLSAVQGVVSALYSDMSTPWYEDRGTTLHGYTNQSFPTTNADGSALQIYSVAYYDTYDFDYNGTDDYGYTSQGLTGEGSPGNSFGMSTGSKKLILGSSNYLYTYTYYDRFGRVIQSRTNNHLSLTVDNLTTVVYDFEGKVLQTKTYHNAGGSNQYTILQTPAYDNIGRTLNITHQINGGTPQVVAAYQYNELGQVVTKQLHNTGGSNYLQNVDLRYNIRGWLSSINNAQLTSDGGVTNNDTNDYFGMELFYNKQENSSLNNTPSYNGNISAVKWKNGGVASGATDQRGYVFAYDASDKLTSSSFKAYDGSSWGKESGTLNETMTYDHNGNILSLSRNQNLRGLNTTSGFTVTSTAQAVDALTYTYANGSGNRLTKVEDAATAAGGFLDGVHLAKEYSYDTLGSLTQDQNKGISAIAYNLIGKPQTVTFTNGTSMSYTYAADGTKLNVSTTVSGTTTSSDYVKGFVYLSGALSFFSSPEGRVVKNSSGGFEYQYAIADHLGNTRVLFTSATQTTQSVTAGFETANQTTEAGNFSNYQTAKINTLTPTNPNATAGNSAYYLNGGYAGQVGIAKSYQVFSGDVVAIQAKAKYNTPSGTASSYTSFVSSLLTAFNLSAPAPGETGTPAAGVNSFGSWEIGSYGDESKSDAMKVFVTIIVFDKNYNLIDVAYSAAPSSGTLFSRSYTIKEAGYAYLYISNEHPYLTDVYFDEVMMSYTPSSILQANEYYPFGYQTTNSWTKTGTVANNFLANGGTELNTTSSLYDLDFRNYDPILGRMNQVDPMATSAAAHTPYNYSFNNPISLNDASGAWPGDWWTYNYNPKQVMDGPGGGPCAAPDPDHPFAGWMGGNGNQDNIDGDMFGDYTQAGSENNNSEAEESSVTEVQNEKGEVIGYSFNGAIAGSIFSALTSGAGVNITIEPGAGSGGVDLVTINVDGLLVNQSSKNLTDTQMNKLAAKIESQIESSFSGKSSSLEWKTNATVSTNASIFGCDGDHFSFILVDDVTKIVQGLENNAVGFSKPGLSYAYINASGNEIARTAAHEFGHALGLGHIEDEYVTGRPGLKFSNDDYFGNLMHQMRARDSNGMPVAGYKIEAWQIYELLIRNLVIPYQTNPMK